MRTLIISGTGQLGSALMEHAPGAIGTYHSKPGPGLVPLDITDHEAARTLILARKPERVILCAAAIAVDFCEEHQHEARKINTEAPIAIAKICKETGAHLTFISTEYVFDGTCGPYREDAQPNPVNHYGATKLQAEIGILKANPRALIIRTTVMYSLRDEKNILSFILRALRSGEKTIMATDQISTPVSADDLARAILALSERKAHGIVHAGGSTLCNRLEFAQAVAKAAKLDASHLVGAPATDTGRKAPRPPRCGLINSRLESEFGIRMQSIDAGIRAYLKP